MCRRFTQRYTWREVHELYDLIGVACNLQAHYNIAPTDTVEEAEPDGERCGGMLQSLRRSASIGRRRRRSRNAGARSGHPAPMALIGA